MIDKNANLIEVGNEVVVPDGNSTDLHTYSFVGIVVDLLENRGTAIVEDQCSDFFEVETDRLIVKND